MLPGSASARDIIVVGASPGGLRALMFLLARLSTTSLAAFFVVVHMIADKANRVPAMLQRASNLSVVIPREGELIKPGRVYLAVPDRHLVLESDHVRLRAAPREHGYRPSIDALFRSAAHSYGCRVVGVLLSGALTDGLAGLAAVKQAGGLTIVQTSNDADVADAAQAAAAEGIADYSVPLSRILSTLRERCAAYIRLTTAPRAEAEDIAAPPRAELVSPRVRALWMAVRLMQEHAGVLRRLAEMARGRGNPLVAEHYEFLAGGREEDADALRQCLAEQPEAIARGSTGAGG